MSQPLPLREQLKALEHLQELDLKIDRLKKDKGSLPAALKALDESLGKLQAGIDSKKAAVGEIEKIQRQTSAALDLNRDRLARSKARLESVQNSQEFQAANKEIEQLNKQALGLEEQSKKSGVEIEGLNKEIADLGGQLDKIKSERDAQAGVLTGQSDKLEGEIRALMTERTGLTGGVEPRVLAQYDRVRVARGGLGIVPAIAGRCKGCNMMVPPQLYNEIQRGSQIHACPSCHRLLFVPAAQGAGIEAAK